jgi:hypothetical protein
MAFNEHRFETSEGTKSRPEPDQKPPYQFRGDKLPPALEHLRGKKCWVAWSYRLKNGKWTKPPSNPCNGRLASVTEPETWGTFDEALAAIKTHNLSGVGLVLTHDSGMTGIDLDDCIRDASTFSELAREVLAYNETYAEVSPSGEGIRLFARGRIERALKDDTSGVEVYGSGRYLTVTGDQLSGTPQAILEAPRTLAHLTAASEAAREAKKRKSNTNGDARVHSNDFFHRVNDAALAGLDAWVPVLHPTATKHATGAWRITSRDLGRDLEEDLSYYPTGIKDHGEEHGLTAIDAVLKYGDAAGAKAAAMWLCQHMGVEPAAMGWKGEGGKERTSTNPGTEDRRTHGRGKQTQADRLIEIAAGEHVELYHTPDGTAFADIEVNGRRETWQLKSAGFRGWLRRQFYLETDGAPNAEAMSTAMGVIEARARFDGVERMVYLRVAELANKLYLDLCNAAWSAVEVDDNGWRIVKKPLVRFRRTPGMLPLPDPESGGSLDELRKHLHVDDNGYVLAVS